MDDVIKRGVHDWLESLKSELDTLKNRSDEEKIKIEVMKARKEIAKEAVDKIENSISREKFYNKYIKDIEAEIENFNNKLDIIGNQHKELKAFFNAVKSTVDASSYR